MSEEQTIDIPGGDEAAAQLAQAVADAKRDVTQTAQAIAEICMLAGCPERAAEFIAAGKSQSEVRRVLIDARAAHTEATEIRSTITAEAGTSVPSHAEASPIVAAVKKLTGAA